MGAFIDLSGMRFGKWTVIAISERKRGIKWLCRCDCGTVKAVQGNNLRRGKSLSCGCEHNHGWKKNKLYTTWGAMKARCYNPNHNYYRYYGGRGISVCEEWRNSFQDFCDWAMANGYKQGLTLDRINGNENYCPENCRFVSWTEQENNRKNNVLVIIDNQSFTIGQLSSKTGIKYVTLYRRYRNGDRGNKLIRPVLEGGEPSA